MMNIFKIVKYQLYLLQLENYELGRYWRLLFKKGLWPKGEQRKKLVWTRKATALMVMAGALQILIGIALYFLHGWIVALIVFALLFTIYFSLFTLSLILLWPFDYLVKSLIISRAKAKIESLKGRKGVDGDKGELAIIGIAGSYGKTTMKEVLLEVLGAKFNTAATPESVNTPVGIARWILKKFDGSLDIAIIEMGEHYPGDIEELCKLTKPDIAVVTGINESHLERMKTLDNIVATVFEVVSGTKAGGLVVLNADDGLVMKNYKKYVWPDHRVVEYKAESRKYKVFSAEKLCWEAEVEGTGKVDVNLLGEYSLGDVDAAVKIAKNLGMNSQEIIAGIKNIKPVEHRLQPIKSGGDVLVIDDSYNGNPAGAAEAIKVLSRFTNRRKIYITPGLVEMGKAAAEIHREIGRQLAGVADVVILIKNSVTPFIEEEIRNYELGTGKKPEVVWFDTAPEAHAALKNILKPGDLILFQNDWGDQYV